ncbi:MAG TPA: hypothetical protein DFS52_31580 [Myxococcales bacterium]|jgi:predicted methyltransferase|nr:hypothetical protein [Myxococcales bacterium]
MRARKGSTFANAVTAHNLAQLVYRLLKYGEAFVNQTAEHYEAHYEEAVKKGAIERLRRMGYRVIIEEARRAVGWERQPPEERGRRSRGP